MKTEVKTQIFNDSNQHLQFSITKITERIAEFERLLVRINAKLGNSILYSNDSADKSEKAVDLMKRTDFLESITENEVLQKSPYFLKLNVDFDKSDNEEDIYFSIFSYPDIKIYSWIAPVARVRFKPLGESSFIIPTGERRDVEIKSKTQYMINEGVINYLSYEDLDYPKTLIYQEAFTSPGDSRFALKEIVARMEEYQDTIIRIPPKGSMLISGPAGSGKTTLALHRVAYLMQSPETKEQFPNHKILILLQDESTKEYFGQLLPTLGIRHVKVDTYFSWARKLLRLDPKVTLINRAGSAEEQDILEYYKTQLLAQIEKIKISTDPIKHLRKIYREKLSPEWAEIAISYLEHNQIDRIDLTIMIKMSVSAYDTAATAKQRRKSKKLAFSRFNLIVIDEAENYTTEEMLLVKSCMNPAFNSFLFIGDLVQQTRLWTIKSWDDIQESFSAERHIALQKVYRNSYEIIAYIKSLGYSVNLGDELGHGPKVEEEVFDCNRTELRSVAQKIAQINDDKPIGILSYESSHLEAYKYLEAMYPNVKVLPIYDAQGVEFESVFLVGVSESWRHIPDKSIDVSLFLKEKESVLRDLIYVALTRASKMLYVSGETSLAQIIPHKVHS